LQQSLTQKELIDKYLAQERCGTKKKKKKKKKKNLNLLLILFLKLLIFYIVKWE
jgi:predicted nucleic acid-binding Zn ribbon protein